MAQTPAHATPVAPHMMRGFKDLNETVALSAQKMVTARGNVQYAASAILYARRRRK